MIAIILTFAAVVMCYFAYNKDQSDIWIFMAIVNAVVCAACFAVFMLEG